MYYRYHYSDRVELQEDGAYRWRCAIDKQYERRIYSLTMKACGFIALLMLVFGAFLSSMGGSWEWEPFLIVTGCTAVFLVITGVVCLAADRLQTHPSEIYEMTEDHIMTGTGRSSDLRFFKGMKRAVVRPAYLELKGAVRVMRVYAPAEDMSFVRSFILARLPGSADIRYEQEAPADRPERR